MTFKIGDFVDWNGKNDQDLWHGVVVKVHPDGKIDTMWLKSNVSRDYSKTGNSSKPQFHRGYTTQDKVEDIIACTNGDRHPKFNRWGDKYGIPG